jgi:hypothetical protein
MEQFNPGGTCTVASNCSKRFTVLAGRLVLAAGGENNRITYVLRHRHAKRARISVKAREIALTLGAFQDFFAYCVAHKAAKIV